jgi:hypothetical protein
MKPPRVGLTWIDTTGGPHLVVPGVLAGSWQGCLRPSDGRVVDARFRHDPSGPATDYDRACDVVDWIGTVSVGDGVGLILSGDVGPVAYVRPGPGEHFLLRWLCAPNEGALLDYFERVRATLTAEERAVFRHPGGSVLLADASDSGPDWASPHLAFELPAGTYQVSATHSAGSDVAIVAHRLVPV